LFTYLRFSLEVEFLWEKGNREVFWMGGIVIMDCLSLKLAPIGTILQRKTKNIGSSGEIG